MTFDEAKARMDIVKPRCNGIEYDGTSVGSTLDLIKVLNGLGDSYEVKYRELKGGGAVSLTEGIANYNWIVRQAFQPGIELVEIRPTDITLARWTAIDSWLDKVSGNGAMING